MRTGVFMLVRRIDPRPRRPPRRAPSKTTTPRGAQVLRGLRSGLRSGGSAFEAQERRPQAPAGAVLCRCRGALGSKRHGAMVDISVANISGEAVALHLPPVAVIGGRCVWCGVGDQHPRAEAPHLGHRIGGAPELI